MFFLSLEFWVCYDMVSSPWFVRVLAVDWLVSIWVSRLGFVWFADVGRLVG